MGTFGLKTFKLTIYDLCFIFDFQSSLLEIEQNNNDKSFTRYVLLFKSFHHNFQFQDHQSLFGLDFYVFEDQENY